MKTILNKISLRDIIQVVIVALVVYGLFFKKDTSLDEVKEYWENKEFKTDTVNLQIDYTKIKMPEFKYDVPPAKVYNYYSKDSTVLSHTSLVMDDSLLTVIDSLQKNITKISIDYLKLYPNASKIIYGAFTNDSVRFDLLAITGVTSSISYGVNYERYRYQYIEGSFKADPITSTVQEKKLRTMTYGFLGYDVNRSTPLVGIDYSLFWRKFRVQAGTSITLDNTPTFIINGNIGFKIK
jgi:hypothetical protein